MAPNLTPSDPRNVVWITLCDKQMAELEEFQKGVEVAKAEFFKNIEKKREDLTTTHQREKNAFLNKEQANGTGTALPKKSGDRPRQTPASTFRASLYRSTPQACPVKQTTSDVINLCSDEDEPVFLEQRNVSTSSSSAPASGPALSRDNSKPSKVRR
ncbi:hypothetical protein COCMIDRAFT_98859 [Bipolaris oryzae ATCC 44560]|uniref:Uncharacterized protein n=1 Tax=Bipolaris oryzae ATCC 44560 TaxID=930090 RepID=W6ZKU8_COCMI|nr:uncharacterized protein COCMIDRAFT_98859 [Bipolaris oryzae ATCC 44560]EUC44191.1 hypothetical protein COCMIDRAFT_98859 [Bipolaris oryzae ATCC 44560]